MRMSCNGCRVLRKGCSDNCSIRPCLQWIKSPESQANATVFLAKFYGRAGLMNLINAGPEHHRPAIFRSLLFEACGRIVNPISGSAGLLWSGSWQLCHTAVEAVLNGTQIVQISSEAAESSALPPFKAYDIRHVSKDQPDQESGGGSRTSAELHKVTKATRTRFKRSTAKPPSVDVVEAEMCEVNWHESLGEAAPGDGDSKENESMYSVDTMEASHVSQGEPGDDRMRAEGELELELTLGLDLASRGNRASTSPAAEAPVGWDVDIALVGLELQLSSS